MTATFLGMTTHQMDLEASYPGEYLFTCPTCERKLVFKLGADAGMTIINQGDSDAMHSGGAGLSLAAELGQ